MGKLEGKVAIVTGAGQGVGKGIALAFAKEGAKVVVADINPETARATAVEINSLGAKAVALTCDVGDEKQVKSMVRRSVKQFGPIDILVNNAQKVPPPLPLEEGDDAWWDACQASGPKGTWYCCKAVFPYMKERGGKIINFGSRAGLMGKTGRANYAAAKEAIRGFSRVAAREWGKYGITVNVICPSAKTPGLDAFESKAPELARAAMAIDARPIPRLGDPERDIGRAAVFLASADADYITGQTLIVSGGHFMF